MLSVYIDEFCVQIFVLPFFLRFSCFIFKLYNIELFVFPVLLSGFLGGSEGKESACNARDPGSIPGLGRFPGEENGNPL